MLGQTLWGPIFGTPGSGKSTFLQAYDKVARRNGIKTLFIRVKDCTNEIAEIEIPDLEAKVAQMISSVLHFTADDLKPSFDALIMSRCNSISCLMDFVDKKYRSDIAVWVHARLFVLKDFIRGNTLILPTCLLQYDEMYRRMEIGLIYVLRAYFPHVILMDDMLAIVLNALYGKVWPAMTRPYLASFNYYPTTEEILHFDPTIIAPRADEDGMYKLASKDKYIIIYRGLKWEVPAKEIYELARS